MIGEEVLSCLQEIYQDLKSETMSRLFLSSMSLPRFLMDLQMVSDGREHPSEVSVKVLSRSEIRNQVKTPPFLESRRKWAFLMELEMVSDGREHPSELYVKVSSRSDIRIHVKTAPVLQVSSWSLGGHGHS